MKTSSDMGDSLRSELWQLLSLVRQGSISECERVAEMIIGSGNRGLHRMMLQGVRIERGVLKASRPFVVNPGLQRAVDLFLWRLVLNADDGWEIHPSLRKENIVHVRFPRYPVTVYDEDMEGAVLSGWRIPEEFACLKNIRRMEISFMGLRRFPEFLRGFTRLEYLDLSLNLFIDRIPDWFHDLPVRILDLSHCSLTGLPEQLGGMRELRVLKLTGNRLSGLPRSLFRNRKLIRLDLNRTFIRPLQCDTGDLPGLKRLDLSDNDYGDEDMETFLPPSGLTLLDLGGNRFRRGPACFSQLKGLKILLLDGCGLEEFPEAVLVMKGLRRLDVSMNRIRHLPSGLSGLVELRNVAFEQRCLMAPGYIPEVHGRSIEGLRRLLADHAHVYEESMEVGKSLERTDPRFYFRRWRSLRYWRDPVDFLRFRHRRILFETDETLEGLLGPGCGAEQVMMGVGRVMARGLSHFQSAFLACHRLVDGVFYEMPGLFWPFELSRETMHAAALAIVGRMSEADLSASFGEGRIRRLFDTVDGSHGFTGHFPHLEEVSVLCGSGKVPEGVFRQPSLRSLTLYRVDLRELERVVGMQRFEHLTFHGSVIRETLSLRGLRRLKTLRLDTSHDDPYLLILDMPDLEVLQLNLGGRLGTIVIQSCPRLRELGVSGHLGSELFIRGCPSMRVLRMRDVGKVDLKEIVLGCPALEDLRVRNCGIAGIPEETFRLKGLDTLEFDRCGVGAIPGSVCESTSLRVLSVRNTEGLLSRDADEPSPVILDSVPAGLFSMPLFKLDIHMPSELQRRLLAVPAAPELEQAFTHMDGSR